MRSSLRFARSASFLALGLLVATPAAAHAESADLLSPSFGLMFWTLGIFLVLFFILSKFAFGPITAAVEAREKALEEAIENAKRDRDEAARILAEHKAALDASRDEAQKVIADARLAGERVKNEMIEATRKEQQDMTDRARREIENEKVRAIADLRREAVDLAIAGAGKVIEKNLDTDANKKLVESFLASIGTGKAGTH
ncbi:MAG: synthase subunit b [Gemmatimonadetes bacterium]|nr:synthase subunit b [Gemmatimonadota bacterium]